MSNFDNLDLVTSVELRNTGTLAKPVYHFIYASQLYGTLFGIYGRFEGIEINSGGAYQIEKISLKLLNYKGVINIGFTNDSLGWNLIDDNNGSMDFHIIGMSTDIDKQFTFTKPLIVTKGIRFGLVFNRILVPMNGFERGSFGPPEDASGRLRQAPPTSPYFDTEFNERDGVDFYNRELKQGLLGYSPPSGQTQQYTLVSPRCIESNVSLIY